jgi:hypothetical protein
MARPFRDVPEPAVKNARISVSFRMRYGRAPSIPSFCPVPLPDLSPLRLASSPC